MEKEVVFIFIGLFLISFVFANTTLNNEELFINSSMTEISYIQDNDSGGSASYLDGAWALYVSGDYAYVVSKTDDSFTIVDISNRSNPYEVSYLVDDSSGGTATALDGPNELSVSGKYAYVTSGAENAVVAIDISNASNPFEATYIQDNDSGGSASYLEGCREIFVPGKYAYVASQDSDSLTVIEVSGIDIPAINTGSIQTSTLFVTKNLNLAGSLNVLNSLNFGGSVLIEGSVGIIKSLSILGNLTVGSDSFFIDSSSNKTGVNTTSPSHTFNVQGKSNFTDVVIIGDGDNQINLTMTSADGNEWCCGVSNDGTFNCSSGAC